MKNTFIIALLSTVFIFLSVQEVVATPTPPNPNSPGAPLPGIAILVAAGVAFGSYKAYQGKNSSNNHP